MDFAELVPSLKVEETVRSTAITALLAASCLALAPVRAAAQTILFDFENATVHSPLPVDVTAGGITAHLSATGGGFSIQQANAYGFTPTGFSGLCVMPSSVSASDLHISFSRALHYLSIMYAPEEYGCDSSAQMRITGYANGVPGDTSTTTAPNPGTWPTGTLILSTAQPFDSVVIHYDAPPPTGGDWGPIFMADNMTVDAAPSPLGDADGNGFLNVLDVFYLINGLFAGGPAPVGTADVNADGKVDIGDVFYLINYFFAGGPAPH